MLICYYVAMEINESYRYVGVLASFTAWLAIAIVLWRWPRIKSQSISKHVSAYKKAWLIFAPIESVALILFYVFMSNWFIPVLELPAIYTFLITLSLLLEFITTWVPDVKGWKQTVHHYTAYGAVLILPFITVLVALSPDISLFAELAAWISLAIMFTIISLYLSKKDTRKNHLIYQSVYFACFHIPVLAVIFTA